MYAGAGAAPLLAAAGAWNGIASELTATAASFESVVTRLTSEQWLGPASLSMVAAAQPQIEWLSYAADCSALAAAQAMASVAAYETAFAMTVPPAAVAANRAQLAYLTATNVFGQNVPAIAATEARYGEMWAQDAAAMYRYAASSSVAGRLNPLTSPAEVTNPAGIGNQMSLGSVVSTGPDAVMSLASPATPEGSASVVDLIRQLDSTHFPWLDAFHHNRATFWDYIIGLTTSGQPVDDADTDLTPAALGVTRAATAAHSVTAAAAAPPPQASWGRAASVGRLSVPPSWSAAAPAMTLEAPAAGTGWAVPGEDDAFGGTPPTPGMPASDEDAASLARPRYGVKPTVMPTRGLF